MTFTHAHTVEARCGCVGGVGVLFGDESEEGADEPTHHPRHVVTRHRLRRAAHGVGPHAEAEGADENVCERGGECKGWGVHLVADGEGGSEGDRRGHPQRRRRRAEVQPAVRGGAEALEAVCSSRRREGAEDAPAEREWGEGLGDGEEVMTEWQCQRWVRRQREPRRGAPRGECSHLGGCVRARDALREGQQPRLDAT